MLECADRWGEEVLAACGRNPLLHLRDGLWRRRDLELPLGSGLRNDGVVAVGGLRKVDAVDPVLLDELELAFDRALVAGEAEAAIMREIGTRRVRALGLAAAVERPPERDAPAHDPTPLGLLLARRLLITRIGLANVSGARHLQAVRVVLLVLEVVDVVLVEAGWVSRARISGNVVGTLQRRAASVTADHLCTQEIDRQLRLRRLRVQEVEEGLDVLTQATEDEVGAVLRPRRLWVQRVVDRRRGVILVGRRCRWLV